MGTLRLAVLTDEFCYTYNQLMRLRSKRNFSRGPAAEETARAQPCEVNGSLTSGEDSNLILSDGRSSTTLWVAAPSPSPGDH